VQKTAVGLSEPRKYPLSMKTAGDSGRDRFFLSPLRWHANSSHARASLPGHRVQS